MGIVRNPSRRFKMKNFNRNNLIAAAFVLLAVGMAAGYYLGYERGLGKSACDRISSFEECVAAGYPIMESYPEQCMTPDGRTFTRRLAGGKENLIRVENPAANGFVASPLVIRGEARGNWFFEATFPIELLDGEGKAIAGHYAEAQGDWMTADFVPFEAVLNFEKPATQTGTLVLKKSNPSGLPEHDDELRIPVAFERLRTINLYYYNLEFDRDDEGNVLCSRKGLAPVEREIPLTITPIKDAVNLLLKGELTAQEQARNIATEYPLEGLALKKAVLKDGVLTLEFDDPLRKTVGGSCRVGILWFQIEATAKQFPEVKEVKFHPEELFQP